MLAEAESARAAERVNLFCKACNFQIINQETLKPFGWDL
jgi:hypothetical protein